MIICPNCGTQLSDEELYCGNCGYEIKYVPEYEPEYENSINESLSDLDIENEKKSSSQKNKSQNGNKSHKSHNEAVAKKNGTKSGAKKKKKKKKKKSNSFLSGFSILPDFSEKNEYEKAHDARVRAQKEWIEKKPHERMSHSLSDTLYYDSYSDEDFLDEDDDFAIDPFDDFAYETIFLRWLYKIFSHKIYRWIAIISILILLGGGVLLYKKISDTVYRNNSYEYQMELAQQAAANGDYVSAIEYMENALMLNSTDTSIKYTLSEYYFANNQQDQGVLLLWEIIDSGDSNAVNAYDSIISYYEGLGDFEMIKNILENCSDSSITAKYGNYFASVPSFSFNEGTYEDAIYLEITSDNSGTIYYTTDGTDPTTDSLVYSGPIFLELGIYKINAMFVNDYGIQSSVVSKTYTIDIKVPYPPSVLTLGGDYTSPELIEVDVQKFCTVYYTTDGTIPTLQSEKYETPLPMPIGSSHFIFIAFSQEGAPGEVTEVDYNLSLNSTVDISEVTSNLYTYNYLAGRSVDTEGHIAGNSTVFNYIVSNAININDKDYYIFVETLLDVSGNALKTGSFFLVDTSNGDIYVGTKDAENNILLSNKIDPSQYTMPDEGPSEPEPGDENNY